MTNKCFINGVQYKCRTCFDPATTVYTLAEECTNSRTCQDLLNDIAKLKTNEDELLPNTICSKCLGKLINCYDFILHIQNVNEKYHKLLSSGKHSSQNDGLPSSSKNIAGYLAEYATALPLDRCVSEIKMEDEELMPYDIVLNSDERRNDSAKGVYNIRDELDELLQSLNLIEVKPYLKKSQITLESLKYLSREDIKEAIPPIGLRACFREKLFIWRKSQYGIDDDNLPATVANKVVSWLQNSRNLGLTSAATSSIFSTSNGNSKLSKGLELILKDSLKGKAITKYYEKSNRLTDLLRTDLINIILEDILYHEVKLSPKDFPPIVDEIIGNFPCEIKEYYFIPRGRKANPGGKLWDRYVNQKSKRGRLLRKFEDGLDVSNESPAHSEVDELLLEALKTSLSKDFSNWDVVKDKWQRTFPLRQRELKSSKSNFEFLNDWPLYSNPRSLELINIDFELLYPNKAHLLFSKWREFTQKIDNYYHLNIKDKKSKELLALVKETSNQNSVDYIYTILLNSVIIPTARFSDDIGKNLKKISITDANESFVLHLTTISDCEKVITELKDKFFSKDLTVQPLIIVVGDSINNLEQFYVYFDKTLLQFDSFLQSLDICFKITNALNLEYPKGCQGPWLFIQEYFYEIKDVNERKLCSIYSLFNFLKP